MLKKESALIPPGLPRDPFTMLRRMASELDRVFDEASWPSLRWPSFVRQPDSPAGSWAPRVDVFERDNRLVTKIDLPGVKKEDVKVEVADRHLAISGERKSDTHETTENFYRSECEYGSFYRLVPLPEGVKLEDVKATFENGVLQVSVPLPAKAEAKPRQIEIEGGAEAAKPAA
jgi:HSP20 family protein